MKLRRMTAVFASKFIAKICRMLGKQGVTWAGKIALMIDPAILSELAGDVREKIFVVCGTNGKTTTNNLLCSSPLFSAIFCFYFLQNIMRTVKTGIVNQHIEILTSMFNPVSDCLFYIRLQTG